MVRYILRMQYVPVGTWIYIISHLSESENISHCKYIALRQQHIAIIPTNSDLKGGESVEILSYVVTEALILIPVLIIIGQILKSIQKIPDKWIPVILLPIGIVGAMALGSWTVDSAIQGILVTGAAVYGNQLVKQLKKDE